MKQIWYSVHAAFGAVLRSHIASKRSDKPRVAAYVEVDGKFRKFFLCIAELVELVLPGFVQQGKKYPTITFGCTGRRHGSVHMIEKSAKHLTSRGGMGHPSRV